MMNNKTKFIKNKKKNQLFVSVLVTILVLSPLFLFCVESFSNIRDTNKNKSLNHPIALSSYYETTNGTAWDICIHGDLAYIANNMEGLAIVNITDPTNSILIKTISTGGIVWGLCIDGDYLYVADIISGIIIFNISEPINPSQINAISTEGTASDVYICGDYAYIADGDEGLAVIDISDPFHTGTPIYKNTTGFASNVFSCGDYAYIADGQEGLAVIDITDPKNPSNPVYEATNGNAEDVFINGDYAYIADGDEGLAVIDISNPNNPELSASINSTGVALGIWVEGNYAYVADFTSGIAVFNITFPTNPKLLGYEDTTGYARGIYIEGNYAFTADSESGLVVIPVSSPIEPEISANYHLSYGFVRALDISGDYLYLVETNWGMQVLNISDPTHPTGVSSEYTYGIPQDIFIEGNYAYVADGLLGLKIIDISDPTNSGPSYELDTDPGVYGVYVGGDIAYLAVSRTLEKELCGLSIVNVSDPTNPSFIVNFTTEGSAHDVYISGHYAYIADGEEGLKIVNVSDPTNPFLIKSIPMNGFAYDVCVIGDYAYVADSDEGLIIVDVSDPMNAWIISSLTTSFAYGLDISGDYAYIANGANGLIIIDISNPLNPLLYANITTGGIALNVAVCGDYAYVSASDNHLVVLKIRERRDFKSPYITDSSSNRTIDQGYTNQTIFWTAIDSDPYNYTILHQGEGIVVNSTSWTSNNPITYNIPEGLTLGEHLYTINITDDYGLFTTHTINITIIVDQAKPIITVIPSNSTIIQGYENQTISWTATDTNPYNYTIQLQGEGIVVNSTPWENGVEVVYNVSDDLPLREYLYTINFTDTNDNYITQTVNLTIIEDTFDPIFITQGVNQTFESGIDLVWHAVRAIDDNPYNYTVEYQGVGMIKNSTSWENEEWIIVDYPRFLPVGCHFFRVNFTDEFGNFAFQIINITIIDTTNPEIQESILNPDTLVEGYSDESLCWRATDINPGNYTIELEGFGFVVELTTWEDNIWIYYDIPLGLTTGTYNYTIAFFDAYGNSNTYLTSIIITSAPPELDNNGIPFGNAYLIFFILGILSLVIFYRKKIKIA